MNNTEKNILKERKDSIKKFINSNLYGKDKIAFYFDDEKTGKKNIKIYLKEILEVAIQLAQKENQDKIIEAFDKGYQKGFKDELEYEQKETAEKVKKLKEYIIEKIDFMHDNYGNACSEQEDLILKIDEIFENNSQQINVEGKPMIPPTPKISDKANLVTADTIQEINSEKTT